MCHCLVTRLSRRNNLSAVQTSTFEAERQAFYDNEQHLKSRIQSLSQARKAPRIPRAPSVVDPESEAEWMEDDDQPSEPTTPLNQPQGLSPEAEPAEMTALKLELSTLSTSHASLQNTLQLIQTQLIDLKRVNNQLQEDNESYNILLREKTLSGTFDLMKQVGGISESSSDRDDDDTEGEDSGDMNSLPNSSRSALGTVEERDERVDERVDVVLDPGYNKVEDEMVPGAVGETMDSDHDSIGDSTRSSRKARGGRRRAGSTSQSPGATRGESLAGLPITGPGLDLAAELGRAENNAILEGQTIDDRDKSITNKGAKRGKKDRKVSYASEAGGEPGIPNDVESLRNEVKSLKDANKALSLYASKIIDRIISQEGFEHVLAADYEKQPPTPNSATMQNKSSSLAPPTKMQRRASMFSRSSAPPPPEPAPVERLTTFSSPPLNSGLNTPPIRTQRRSLSFDWRGFSVFGGGEKKDNPTNSRSMTLKPGAVNSVPGARKLDTQEDDDDRRERERLAATMKLMGIEKPLSPPVIHKSFSNPTESTSPSLTISPPLSSPSISTPSTSRFSLFRRSSSAANSDGSSKSAPVNLTEDALAMSEAENTLAALDAQEKAMSAEMAKGAGSGFTEIVPRRKSGSRRSRTSGGGSGSTVWSAGMSREADDGDD